MRRAVTDEIVLPLPQVYKYMHVCTCCIYILFTSDLFAPIRRARTKRVGFLENNNSILALRQSKRDVTVLLLLRSTTIAQLHCCTLRLCLREVHWPRRGVIFSLN